MSALVRWAGRVFARVLAPDLGGRPAYVVPMSRVGVRDTTSCPVAGWSGPLLDLELRRPIGRAWRGRGPAAVLADHLSPADVLAVAAHEFAHRLDEPELYATLPQGLVVQDMVSRNPGLTARSRLSASRPQAVTDHGPGFCRLALHLAERAGDVTGVGACPRVTLGYPWLVPFAYSLRRHLWAEIETWGGRSLGWVKAQPLPAGFAELWQEAAIYAEQMEAAALAHPAAAAG